MSELRDAMARDMLTDVVDDCRDDGACRARLAITATPNDDDRVSGIRTPSRRCAQCGVKLSPSARRRIDFWLRERGRMRADTVAATFDYLPHARAQHRAERHFKNYTSYKPHAQPKRYIGATVP